MSLLAALVASATAIVGGTVIDGTGAPPLAANVVIEDGRIASIGGAPPAGARVIDARGLYLIPALVDAHAHVTIVHDAYSLDDSREVLRTLQCFGVLHVRNPAAPAREAVALRDAHPGPDIVTAGEAIDAARPGLGLVFKGVSDDAAARAEVRRQVAIGVDAIKVYSSLPPPLVRAVVDEAHRLGRKVIGHLGRTSWREASEAGIDAIAHGAPWDESTLPRARQREFRELREPWMKKRLRWLEWLDLGAKEIDATISSLVRHGVTVEPTLVAYDTKFHGDEPRYTESPDLRFAPLRVVEEWRRATFVSDWTAADFTRAHALWPRVLAFTRLLHDRGVKLLAGSDMPNPWVVPGAGLHRELELLASAGIAPLEVLRMATGNGAEALGIAGRTGTIAAGKDADLVLLEANPLDDIRNTRRIREVWQRGVPLRAGCPQR